MVTMFSRFTIHIHDYHNEYFSCRQQILSCLDLASPVLEKRLYGGQHQGTHPID